MPSVGAVAGLDAPIDTRCGVAVESCAFRTERRAARAALRYLPRVAAAPTPTFPPPFPQPDGPGGVQVGALPREEGGRSAPSATRRELVLALLAALVLCAIPVRRALLDPDRVLLGVDTASVQLPWRAVIDASDGETRPRNAGLSDQGVVFYPYHRWVIESWLAGDPPLWNPHVYAGVPGLGNPQSGAVDPQVLFRVGLARLGGDRLADMGYAWIALLRLVAAAFGGYCLARCLGLGPPGAAVAGSGFALSGYLTLWLGHPLGHVPPLLPWVLLGLEGLRGRRPLASAAGAAAALALAILGGHPETAFYVGLAGGLWALAIGLARPRTGLAGLGALAVGTAAGAVLLLPFVEYLGLSAAQSVRERDVAHSGFDLVALGVLVLLAGLVAAWRIQATSDEERTGPAPSVGLWLGAVGLALAVGGAVLFLRARGLPDTGVLALLFDFHGAPGRGGYRGPGTYLEEASAWLPPATLLLALAAVFGPRGRLRRRGLVVVLGLVAWLLCLRVPGLLDAYRRVPVVGLSATVRFGVVSALFLSLLAGDALERAPRLARGAAVAVGAALFLVLAWEVPPPAVEAGAPQREAHELAGFVLVPDAELSTGLAPVEGWVDPRVAVDRVAVRVEPLDGQGAPRTLACVVGDAPTGRARREAPELVEAAPEGAQHYRTPHLQANRLEPGRWRFVVDFYAGGSAAPALSLVAATSRAFRPGGASNTTRALALLAVVLVLLPPRRRALQWALAALAIVQGLHFAEGANPAVPRAEVFPETETERVVRELQGPGRFLSDPGVLPPNTGLVRGLRALDGYDGMDVQAFNGYRPLALRPASSNALLDWNARGVALGWTTFRLLGAHVLVTATPLVEADARGAWELVAGPRDAPRAAECFVYRARDPLPRAFCVPRLVTADELGDVLRADPAWDPTAVAHVDASWRPAEPFTEAEVYDLAFVGNNEVHLRARLDGDGLLVLTEQSFPGWTATVDGEETEVVTANAIFRAVPLEAGEHEVVFRYRPTSAFVGAAVSLVAWLAIVGAAVVGLLWRRR